jgi:tetratricopeptide (TPR) repeat protein
VSRVWAARLQARQAMTLIQLGKLDQAERMARQALAAAERAGDRFAAGYALFALSLVDHFHRRDHATELGHLGRALAVIGDDPQTTDLRVLLLTNRAAALQNLDRPAEAGATIQEALALAERAGTPRMATICTTASGFYFEVGQWDDALATSEAAVGLPGSDDIPVLVHGLFALIAGHRDDWETAEQHLAAVPAEVLGSASLRWAACYLLWAQALADERAGRPGEAVAVLAQCLDPGVAEGMPTRILLLPVLARAALAAGDAAAAAAAARAAAAEAERGPLPCRAAAASWCAGLVAGDSGPVLEAAGYYESVGRPFDRAQALEDAAALLAERGDLPAARRAFTSAAGLYGDLGAEWDLRRANARLSGYGIRPSNRERPPPGGRR